jgi:hypothetical protein
MDLRCKGLTGVHRFEARFDVRLPDGFNVGRVSSTAEGVSMVVESHKSRIYIRDVCVKCGAVIERVTTPPPASQEE